MKKEQFERLVLSDLASLHASKQEIHLTLSFGQDWALLCAVQLASRHPEAARSRTLEDAARTVQQLADAVADTPALRELVRQGWSKEFDR